MVADDLSCMTNSSVSYVNEAKNDLVNNVHRIDRLGVILEDSSKRCFMVHRNSEPSFLVEVKSKQHLDQILMRLKESVLGNLIESLGGCCPEVSRKVVSSRCRYLEEPDS